MFLDKTILKDKAVWEEQGYRLPAFDREAMLRATEVSPTWIHFGAGNIFKAFQADSCQRLLDAGRMKSGIIAVERRRKVPEAHDELVLKVTLRPDGKMEKVVIGSIAETVSLQKDAARLAEIFEKDSLQIVSFTITEKGYNLTDGQGEELPEVTADRNSGPDGATSYMGRIAALLYRRYQKSGAPVALVSMDNCSHNGDRLRDDILVFASAWGDDGFLRWLGESVTFPWTMIDKITPLPSPSVAAELVCDGWEEGTPFVNAEEKEYLFVENSFPNGRPPLEEAGWVFTSREAVEKAERMKVCTCLNPLHTALAVFGCLLGYEYIWQEMKDEDLCRLVEVIGYREGLPTAEDPGAVHPKEFIDTVIRERIPNPFLPDTPQRIATDTSQKLPIRYGETLKSYVKSSDLRIEDLIGIPLVLAGWLRYLMGVDDAGRPMELSPDPMLDVARSYICGAKLGKPADRTALYPLLRNRSVFGVDLCEVGLAERICGLLDEMTAAKGSVRAVLHRCMAEKAS